MPKEAKTILKCTAWGDCVEALSGKLAFRYVCPIVDVGIKSGFVAFKVLKRNARIPYAEVPRPKSPRRVKARLVQSTIRGGQSGNRRDRSGRRRSPLAESLVSQLRTKRRLTSSTMRPKPRELPKLDYKQTMAKVQAANARLEEEVAEIERRAAELELDD